MQNTADFGDIFLSEAQSSQVYGALSILDNLIGFTINNAQVIILYSVIFAFAISVPIWFLVFYFKRQSKKLDEEESERLAKEPKGKVAQILDS